MSPTKAGKKGTLLKILLGILAALLAGGVFFVYEILPQKVAQGLVARSQVREPLTESPKDYGIPGYQDVTFTDSDGVTLSGWWLPVKGKPQGTVILTHGVFKNRQQVLGRAAFLWKLGYQVLLFDLRGNGQSGPSPVSGGLLESGDFLAAESFLEAKHQLKKPVVFFGFSLGAMCALRAGVSAPQLDAIIADGPLANVKSYVSRRTIGGSFTSLPGFLPRVLRDYDQLTGLSLTEKDLDLVPVVEQLKETPVLYLTSQGDDLAKANEVQQLFAKTPARHRRLAYLPEAGHEESFKKYPMIYEKMVKEFLADLKKGFPKSDDIFQDR